MSQPLYPQAVLPPAPNPTRIVLSLSRGPSIVVDVIEERTRAGNVLHHVIRYSRFGGPVALVAKDIMGSSAAIEIARAELA